MEKTFRHFGTMVDCSRNAVMRPEALRRWIDLTGDLGYDSLMLYTEDTYEVPGEPRFGYMRGRYTQKELRELDAYARERGVELIPCVQTLAHLNALVRWPEYREHVDTGDILLAGDERVYTLIEHIFAALAETFTSRTVNIGMDEAHLIGRGRYYDLHGDEDRFAILLAHLNRVAEIGKKYGFSLLMWSDMFFRLATGGEYYRAETIDPAVAAQIPENVTLIYWDYYSRDPEHYRRMLAAHGEMKPGAWFAGGLWTWAGFAPHNGFSLGATKAAFAACRDQGVQDVFLTLWGDDGGVCSRFALLPALYAAARMAQGVTDEAVIRKGFAEKFGISWEDFMLLDLPGTPNGAAERVVNADKYLFYNDPFTGLMDSTLSGGEGEAYGACAARLEAVQAGEWTPVFACAAALCRVLETKAELGLRTYNAYTSGDRETLADLPALYRETEKRLEAFISAFRAQWDGENKPQGFEVQEIRLGGLLLRLKSCRERLEAYHAGTLDSIPELEETRLPEYSGHGAYGHWQRLVSVNTI